MRIALFGYGGVGKAFVRLISQRQDQLRRMGMPVTLTCVAGRKGGIYDERGIDTVSLARFSAEGAEMMGFTGFSDGVDVETVIAGGNTDLAVIATPTDRKIGKPGIDIIKKLLKSGIHVVTADKGPVLLAYDELAKTAKKNGVQFAAGCTTGGALPAINGGMIDMAGAEIRSIEGVLNGTTNYILDRMETSGISLCEALEEAKRAGIAEADPSLDIEGWDTAIKLLILAKLHMGIDASLDNVRVQGITGLTPLHIEQAKKQVSDIDLSDGQKKPQKAAMIYG